jgi:hydroxymethylglutaryl-CoA reductase
MCTKVSQKTSRERGFYNKTHSDRLKIIKNFSALAESDIQKLKNLSLLDFETANRMIENVISAMPIPLGIAANFLIDNKEYFVPMAIEEASVVAAASHAAKLARATGGFSTKVTQSITIGQIQLKNIPDVKKATAAVEKYKEKLIAFANSCDPVLIEVGGGVRDIKCRPLKTSRGDMLILHLLVDVQDAMGANIVNRMGEKITPLLEQITRAKTGVRIISNLSTHRMVESYAVWRKKDLSEKIIEEILDVYELACVDPYRCATHNKGVMNGIDAVAIATGNDFRAIEAGAHSYSCGNKPLTRYYKNKDGDLVGELKMPLTVATVGGITQTHPMVEVCLKILGVTRAQELASVMAAVGLAQNFAALRALASEGISKGHMRLHSKNIAIMAGAPNAYVEIVAQQMVDEDNISVARARELVEKLGL